MTGDQNCACFHYGCYYVGEMWQQNPPRPEHSWRVGCALALSLAMKNNVHMLLDIGGIDDSELFNQNFWTSMLVLRLAPT